MPRFAQLAWACPRPPAGGSNARRGRTPSRPRQSGSRARRRPRRSSEWPPARRRARPAGRGRSPPSPAPEPGAPQRERRGARPHQAPPPGLRAPLPLPAPPRRSLRGPASRGLRRGGEALPQQAVPRGIGATQPTEDPLDDEGHEDQGEDRHAHDEDTPTQAPSRAGSKGSSCKTDLLQRCRILRRTVGLRGRGARGGALLSPETPAWSAAAPAPPRRATRPG
jgi:hypothetical protein